MVETINDWPADISPKLISFRMRGMTVTGPRTLTGRSQTAAVDAGFWSAVLSDLTVGGAARVKAWRSFLAELQGASGLVRVPVFDREQIPWVTPGVYTAPETEFTDGTRFTDGTGFRETVIRVTVNGAAAVRATQIGATIDAAGTIQAGVYFTLGEHLYVIRRVVSSSGSDRVWSIWPPLRKAAADNAHMEFDAPTCLMRLVSDAGGDLSLTLGRYGFPDAELHEVVT